MLTTRICAICDRSLPVGDNGWSVRPLAMKAKVEPATGRDKKAMHMECAERVAYVLKDSEFLRNRRIAA